MKLANFNIKNFLNILEKSNILFNGICLGLLVFIFTSVTCYYLIDDGINLIDLTLITIIPGLYYLFLTIVVNTIVLNKYIRESIASGEKPLKKVLQIILVFVVSYAAYIFFDSIHFMIDDSIPVRFAKALSHISNLSEEQMLAYGKHPFFIQTIFVTIFMGILGSFISLLFIKKDGNIIGKSSREW
jgi:hypothetical protein